MLHLPERRRTRHRNLIPSTGSVVHGHNEGRWALFKNVFSIPKRGSGAGVSRTSSAVAPDRPIPIDLWKATHKMRPSKSVPFLQLEAI